MKKGEGWVMPTGARKFHYFEDHTSLCGRYGFMATEGDEDTGEYDSDDCTKCVKELLKRKRKNK